MTVNISRGTQHSINFSSNILNESYFEIKIQIEETKSNMYIQFKGFKLIPSSLINNRNTNKS